MPNPYALHATCSRSIAAAKLAGVGSHRNPVRPCTTLSRGPPLLHAITGRPAAIACGFATLRTDGSVDLVQIGCSQQGMTQIAEKDSISTSLAGVVVAEMQGLTRG